MSLNEMDVVAAAEHVGMRENAFRELCKKGEGPKCRRDGRSLRFTPAHLDEWLKEFNEKAYSPINAKTVKTGKKAPAKGKSKNPLD